MTAGRRIALRVLWVVVFGAPVVGLTSELLLLLDWRVTRRGAEERRREHPTVFDIDGPKLAQTRSLWRVPWQAYQPNARLEIDLGSERYVVEINSRPTSATISTSMRRNGRKLRCA